MPRGAPPPVGGQRKPKVSTSAVETEMTDTEADRTGTRPADSEPFEAKCKGRCSYGDGISPGELAMYEEGNVVHVECAAEPLAKSDGKRYPFSGTTLEEMGF